MGNVLDSTNAPPVAGSFEPLTTAPLQSGDQVEGRQDKYTVEKYLGQGLTALVYKAMPSGTGKPVALKVLRPEVSPVTRDFFWHEGVIIGELMNAGVDCVPRVLDQQNTGPIKFLAMEYIDRDQFQPLDEMLEHGQIDELVALEITAQSLDMLRKLHGAGRTYTDMQLKNFWWNGRDGVLKVMDWNTVSPRRKDIEDAINQADAGGVKPPILQELEGLGVKSFDDLIRNDLARFGAYLYRMLTGKGAFERGETERALERRAGERWAEISVASRQIIVRALHPDPSRRYDTAAKFRGAVIKAQDLWRWENGEENIDEFTSVLRDAQSVEVPQEKKIFALGWALALLDMIRRKQAMGSYAIDRYQEDLKKLTGGYSEQWAIGQQYYDAAQYTEAALKWAEEAKAQGRVDSWRWVMIARAGQEMETERQGAFAQIRPQLESVVQAMNDDRWEDARRAFPPQAKSVKAVLPLSWEIEIYFNLLEATAWAQSEDVKHWREASLAFRRADELLRVKIPYSDLMRQENAGWVDLVGQADELDLRASRRDEISSQRDHIAGQLATDFSEGLEQLKLALQRDPGNWDLNDLCFRFAQAKAEIQPEQAQQILETGLLYGRLAHVPDLQVRLSELGTEIREQIHQRQVNEVVEALNTDFESGLSKLRIALEREPANEAWVIECQEYAERQKEAQPERALAVLEVALNVGRVSRLEPGLRDLQAQIKDYIRKRDIEKKKDQLLTLIRGGDLDMIYQFLQNDRDKYDWNEWLLQLAGKAPSNNAMGAQSAQGDRNDH